MPGWMRSGSSPMTARLAAYHCGPGAGDLGVGGGRSEMALGDRPQAVAATDGDGVERRGTPGRGDGASSRVPASSGRGGRSGRSEAGTPVPGAAVAAGTGRRIQASGGSRARARAVGPKPGPGIVEVSGRTDASSAEVDCPPIRSPGPRGRVAHRGRCGACRAGAVARPMRAAGVTSAARLRCRGRAACGVGAATVPTTAAGGSASETVEVPSAAVSTRRTSSGVRWSARQGAPPPQRRRGALESRARAEPRASQPASARPTHASTHDEDLVRAATRCRPGLAPPVAGEDVTACSIAIATSDRPRLTTDRRSGAAETIAVLACVHSMQFACVWSSMTSTDCG